MQGAPPPDVRLLALSESAADLTHGEPEPLCGLGLGHTALVDAQHPLGPIQLFAAHGQEARRVHGRTGHSDPTFLLCVDIPGEARTKLSTCKAHRPPRTRPRARCEMAAAPSGETELELVRRLVIVGRVASAREGRYVGGHAEVREDAGRPRAQ